MLLESQTPLNPKPTSQRENLFNVNEVENYEDDDYEYEVRRQDSFQIVSIGEIKSNAWMRRRTV